MHHVGSEGFQRGLLEKYDYRLGLSATPSRYMDDEGTEVLLNYFDDIVFEFTIKDALIKRNFKNQTFLTPYDYLPEKIELTSKELDDYNELTQEINRLYHINNKTDKQIKSLDYLYRERRSIINNAENKYEVLEKILDKYDDLNHMIIFCSDKQIDNVLKILNDKNIGLTHKFTQSEKTTKSKVFNNISEREFLLKKFDEGLYKVLVAIKCLDEGVDVPSADKVIIMSSTTNPREYIQRRGRVLRRFEGKEKAYIHDMVVVPRDNIKSIQKNERKRMKDFILTASNSNYGVNLLQKWGMFYEF